MGSIDKMLRTFFKGKNLMRIKFTISPLNEGGLSSLHPESPSLSLSLFLSGLYFSLHYIISFSLSIFISSLFSCVPHYHLFCFFFPILFCSNIRLSLSLSLSLGKIPSFLKVREEGNQWNIISYSPFYHLSCLFPLFTNSTLFFFIYFLISYLYPSWNIHCIPFVTYFNINDLDSWVNNF